MSGTSIATSLVGSYPQPDWLIDREALNKRLPPCLRARELWRIAPEWPREAQDDAVVLAIADQERAGLSIITDGEMRRESYSNAFANALDGVDLKHPGSMDRTIRLPTRSSPSWPAAPSARSPSSRPNPTSGSTSSTSCPVRRSSSA
jgi:methionine synthase II (cobalamin-independent)